MPLLPKATCPVPHTPSHSHSLDPFKYPVIASPWLFLSPLQNCCLSLAGTAGTWLFPGSSDRFLSCYSVFSDSRNPLPSSNLVLSLPRIYCSHGWCHHYHCAPHQFTKGETCIFISVTGCALSDSCHVIVKSDWTHSIDFAVQGSREQGREKQSSFQLLCFVLLWVLDRIPSMN